jgi:hypothetical protein
MATQQQKPIDFAGEEQELYSICSAPVVALYKFFDMFRVELGDDSQKLATVYFGKSFEDDEVPKELAKQIRFYVKEQKRELRANPIGYDPQEGRKKVFWLMTMLLEHGLFSHVIGKLQVYATFVYCQTKDDE